MTENRVRDDIGRIAVEQARLVYQDPDALEHFSNPERHTDAPEWWGIANMSEYVEDGGHVLIVGCAGGIEAFALLQAGFRVTGIDIVPEFIEAARRGADEKGVADRTRFEMVDGFSWPLEDSTCNAVTMLANMPSHLPTSEIRRQVFRECYRVLKENGAVFLDCTDRTNPAWGSYRPPEWAPDTSEDLDKKAAWGLLDTPGVIVQPGHPCKGDDTTEHIAPTYEMAPHEAWEEIESTGFFVHTMIRDRPNAKKPWRVRIIATKD